MDILISFKNGSQLFKCDPSNFAVAIKDVLTNILICDKMRDERFNGLNVIKKVKCIICWQYEFDDSQFVICNKCCKLCINENIIIALTRGTYVCRKSDSNYWFGISDLNGTFRANMYYHDINSLLKYFINCSHKLVHRFYHTVPILLLSALRDPNANCNVLNVDIIMYIFRFIY